MIELLRRQLADKEKYLRQETGSDFLEKEGVLGELMVKGYSKENERLIRMCQDLKTMMADKDEDLRRGTKHKAFSENTLRFEEEERLKESISKLQDELQKKDEHYRQREQTTQEKLGRFEEMEQKCREYNARLAGLEGVVESRDKEIHELAKKVQDVNQKAFDASKDGAEEKERMKKEMQKKDGESNRVRDENIGLRKELKALREKLQALESEVRVYKDKKEAGELAKKVAAQNQTIKDLQDKLKQKEAALASAATPTRKNKGQEGERQGPAFTLGKEKPASALPPSALEVLKKLGQEAELSEDLQAQIRLLWKKVDRPSTALSKYSKVPISKEIDILDSGVDHDGYDEMIYAINVDEEFEKLKEDVPVRDSFPRQNTLESGTGQKKAFVRAVLGSMPKDCPVVAIEHLWSQISEHLAPNEPDRLAEPLGQFKDRLLGFHHNIGQEEIVPFVNKSSNLLRRGEQAAAKATLAALDPLVYDWLFSALPALLQTVSLSAGERNYEDMRRELDTLRRDKDALEHLIRQTPITPTAADFALLQRKIDTMEQQQKLKEMEMVQHLRRVLDTQEEETEWKKEREKMVHIIKTKNREITRFRQEVDELVLKLKELRSANKE